MMRILVTLVLMAAGACGREEQAIVPPEGASPSTKARAPIPTLPPDGKQLYEFLMREEPKLMAEIPCACCKLSLADCFEGACPKT